MSIIIHKNTKILVQGFTGKIGSFHAEEMIKYGSNVVGGVTPGKGGMTHLNLPVFNTVKEAVDQTGASTSILFVPPAFAADSAMEAADAGINRCDWVAEGIVQALSKIEIKHPLVIRLAGTNVEKGNEILKKSNINYIEASTLEDAANKAVKALG